MKKINQRANNLFILLTQEAHHKAMIKKLELKEVLSGFDKELYNHSIRENKRIESELNTYTEYELNTGRCLCDYEKKVNVYGKCVMLSLTAHNYIKSVNDFELDEEKVKKITDYQMFLVCYLLSSSQKYKYTYADIFQLKDTALTESQFEQLIFDLKIGNTEQGIKNALGSNEINKYKME